MKYSKNAKLDAVLNQIEQQLLSIADTEEESLSEIRRYLKEFPLEPDYNLYQYGNLLICISDIFQMYRDCGYKSVGRYSDDQLLETYKRQVGAVARALVRRM